VQPPWIWLSIIGPIRISTVLAGLAMASAILWRRRAPLTALIALMAWLSAYEILYQATGTAIHGWSPAYFLWMSAAVSGWVVLGVVRGIVPDRWLLLAVALVWVVWILTGFNSNSPTVAGTSGFPKGFSVSNEIFNELSKTLLAASYLAGALSSRARSKPRDPPADSIQIR
jgi:ABC-type glucose/galactose transport system permease subunit